MREIRWKWLEGEGIEHLAFEQRDDGVHIDSVIVAERDGRAYGFTYRLRCDEKWRVRNAWLSVVGGARLELHSDGEGYWRDGHGLPLTLIEGCIDIDIIATPFTNTLPIRRLALKEGMRETIPVAWISVPDLQITRAEQAYSCLSQDRLYRYEGLTSAYTADLPVDEDGFVIDYPELFKRV